MIIALKGPAQCGKSTLANVLDAEFQYRGFKVRRTAFSDFVREEIVKEICSPREFDDVRGISRQAQHILYDLKTMYGLDPTTLLHLLEARPAPPEVRWIQQWWGQDFRRAQDSLYWIKKSFAANVEYLLDPAYVVIEESCRQPNEGAYVRALGGVIIDLKPLASPTESEAAAMSHSIEQVAMSWEGDFDIDMGEFFNADDQTQMEMVRSTVDDLIFMAGAALPTE